MPTSGELARCGILNTDAAALLLAQLPAEIAETVFAALSEVADPDAALASFVHICEQHSACELLASDATFIRPLLSVLGASPVLSHHFLRHPDDVSLPRNSLLDDQRTRETVIARLLDSVRAIEIEADRRAAVAALRACYRRGLIGVVARDVAGVQPIEVTWRQLSDLADAALNAALHIASRGQQLDNLSFSVVALGKCGAQELNYVSDVDVVFIAEPRAGVDEHVALQAATRIASTLMEICVEPSVEGELWTVDANLRPEGKRGSLVRTVQSYVDYYERWAQPWEFQALLKARAVVGDAGLGEEFVARTRNFVWSAGAHPGYIAQARHLRQRAEQEIVGDAEREIKLGPGGLRDVEFSVQLLQIVHGRDDESLRVSGTLTGLNALADGGYVGRDDAHTLADTYRFLRGLEHRLQLRRLQRTHTLPTAVDELRALGRGMGFTANPGEELSERWRAVALDARRRHEKLFYRPLLDVYARLEPGVARLSGSAARSRYEALGFADPDAAMRHVQALAQGVSRRAAIQRTLLPVILSWLAHAPQPDAGLLAFRRVSEALGETHWYLRTLRDDSVAAQRLITILGTSRWLTELLLRAPDAVAMLADDAELKPREAGELRADFASVSIRHDDVQKVVTGIRAIRRRELLRIGAADVLGLLDVSAVGTALTEVMATTIDATLTTVTAEWERENGQDIPFRLAIIGVGRLGGAEIGYGSDADVLFVHEPKPGVEEPRATAAALAVIAQLRAVLTAPSPEPLVELDVDLRPEGRNGAVVRTLASYATYFDGWSAPWEAQAMLRARPVAGDLLLAQEWIHMINSVRWPEGGIEDNQVREIRRIKARVESERLPRGVDPSVHLKLGPGGLSDVEWAVQLLQLRHGSRYSQLQTSRTMKALAGAQEIGLIAASDEVALSTAWQMCTSLRNRMVLLTGQNTDLFPGDLAMVQALAHVMGSDSVEALRDEHLRVRRRARSVMERVFYGRA